MRELVLCITENPPHNEKNGQKLLPLILWESVSTLQEAWLVLMEPRKAGVIRLPRSQQAYRSTVL